MLFGDAGWQHSHGIGEPISGPDLCSELLNKPAIEVAPSVR
jgi:hypothetical protein